MPSQRVLIVCNDNYPENPLPSCTKDIKDCETAFKASVKRNLTQKDMTKNINDFLESIQPDDIVIFYFSGYITVWRDQSYLLPVDKNIIKSNTTLQQNGFYVQALIDDIAEKNPKAVLFILDCCHTVLPIRQPSNDVIDSRRFRMTNRIESHGKLLFLSIISNFEQSSTTSGNVRKGHFMKYLVKHSNKPKLSIHMVIANATIDFLDSEKTRPHVSTIYDCPQDTFLVEDDSNSQKRSSNQCASAPSNNYNPSSPIKTNTQPDVHHSSGENSKFPQCGSSSTAVGKESSLKTQNATASTTAENNILERRAVDQSGQLGSFYDAVNDKIVYSTNQWQDDGLKAAQKSICIVFSGERSIDLVDYLQKMNYDDAIRQSLLFRVIQPFGVSSLIDYDQEVNEYTRFLYYSYTHKSTELDTTNVKDRLQRFSSNDYPTATHMISYIEWGFEILSVIQILQGESCERVDRLLKVIEQRLQKKDGNSNLDTSEMHQIRPLAKVTTYASKNDNSESDILTGDILTEIRKRWRETWKYKPLLYRMNRVNQYQAASLSFSTPKYASEMSSLEELVSFAKSINVSQRNFRQLYRKHVEKDDNAHLEEQRKHLSSFYKETCGIYNELIARFRVIVIDTRRGFSSTKEVEKLLSDQRYKDLKTNLDTANQSIHKYLKTCFIKDLQRNHIRFKEVEELSVQESEPLLPEKIQSLYREHFTERRETAVLCFSTDQLIEDNPDKWKEILQTLIGEKQEGNENIQVIYVDLTRCSDSLKDFQIIRLPEATKPLPTPVSSPSRLHYTNVLLLGETGVGKSTFINSFANYLRFETLEEAEQSEPVVVIPVSFIVGVGDEFKEKVVKWGDVDTNENFQELGQSVTQSCQSYIFDLGGGRKLRLIDTPGIGDTRGVVQDQIHMNHILEYIDQLPYLNAVCLLLKPTGSKINVFFRSSVLQLTNYLNIKGYQNIIFCFTNSRSTNYNPGETGGLIRRLLKDENLESILFRKINVFCFDDEAFRYLAAIKNNVELPARVKEESAQSWSKSVLESQRFVQSILKLQPYDLNLEKSLMKAILDISTLAQPLMELLRVTIYHWKLVQSGWQGKEIVIQASSLSTKICSLCADIVFVQLGQITIFQYQPTKRKEEKSCPCVCANGHFVIEYGITYKLSSSEKRLTSQQLEQRYKDLVLICDRLSYFLKQNGLNNGEDPFSFILQRFISEAKYILGDSRYRTSILENIHETMRVLWQQRERRLKKFEERKEKLSIAEVYELIDKWMKEPQVKEQWECIKETRRSLMVQTEHPMSIPSENDEHLAKFVNTNM